MNIRYSLVNWQFNMGSWSRAIQEASDEMGTEFVAQALEVSVKTVQNWIKMHESAYGEFPYPNMTNFIRAMNMLDLDPREFFILEDK